MNQKIALLLTLFVFFFSGCGVEMQAKHELYFPTRDWRTAKPEEMGLDPAKFEAMEAHISDTRLNLHSLIIIRDGYIVFEKYYQDFRPGTRHVQFSVTKSIIATLLGIALDQGRLEDVNQPARAFFPEQAFENPDPRKDAMTLEDLLTMRSGLDWAEGDPSFMAMYRSTDWVKWVLDLSMQSDPAESFHYCSGCSHVLSGVVAQAVGMPAQEFARKYLFEPLGIKDYEWETDRQGNAIGGWGLMLKPRDMAKLGYLYLHEGRWEDQQIVSSAWVEAATTKRTDTDNPRLGYGYQWWTYDTHGAYTALGRDGQTIFVVPELDMVIVTTAEITNHDPIFDIIDHYILPAADE